MLVHMTEHKLALGEEVVGEEEPLVEGVVYNTVEDRFSYSSEYTRAGKVGAEVLGDQGILGLPSDPWVPYNREDLGVQDSLGLQEVPCSQEGQEDPEWDKVEGMVVVVVVVVVGVGVGHSMMAYRLEHKSPDIQGHKEMHYASPLSLC